MPYECIVQRKGQISLVGLRYGNLSIVVAMAKKVKMIGVDAITGKIANCLLLFHRTSSPKSPRTIMPFPMTAEDCPTSLRLDSLEGTCDLAC